MKKANPNLIEVENLTLGYNKTPVFKNLSFSVRAGDFICIVGPNGAGKTTLIRGLLGFLEPLSGKISFNTLKPTEIGYLPQETALDPNFPATVSEIILSGTLNRLKKPFYGRTEKRLALEKMRLLQIDNLKSKSFSELSGGQRQRVLLARSLAATSKLLILDEPSNSLDSNTKKDFYSLLEKLNREENLTILMITHDLDHDNLIGNKILSLRDDFFFGSLSEFVERIHNV